MYIMNRLKILLQMLQYSTILYILTIGTIIIFIQIKEYI